MGVNIVKASGESGIEKFVFSSVYHPSLSLTNHAAKRPVEEALYKSDMTFIILQPAMFMQNMGNAWPVIKDSKKVTLPYSKSSRMSYVDFRDVAEVIAIAVTKQKLDNGTFELSSEGTYNRIELTNIIGEVLNTEIKAGDMSFDTFSENIGLPDGFAKEGLRAMFKHYDRYGLHGGNALVLETILGRKPTTLKAYFQDLEERDSAKW